MQITLQAFRLPKAGNSDAENEDACWPDTYAEMDAPPLLKVAVADGATETLFSGLWAGLLAHAYTETPSHSDLLKALPTLRSDWQREIAARPLPWYAEEKARAGAYATLMGLTLKTGHAHDVAYYEALAIGDSCLFHLRDGHLLRAFPLTHSAEFNNSPYLLASHPQRNPDLADHLRSMAHHAFPGDTLLLLTDALAQWFLHTLEADPAASDPLRAVTDLDAFAGLIAIEREAHRLRNDDTTLLRLTLSSKGTS